MSDESNPVNQPPLTSEVASQPQEQTVLAPDALLLDHQPSTLPTNLESPTTPIQPAGPNWPLRFLWLGIAATVGFYVFILPEIQIAWWKYRSPNRMLPSSLQLDIVTRSMLRTLEAFVVGFFFAVGASIGSFLNVVAYRLPNHLDISVAGSRCPKCGKRLTFKENMPLFGWVRLRGKCSGCQIPIPIKYLVAELLLGLIAVWLGAYELLSGGLNLPLRTPNYYAGVVWIVFYTKWDLVSYTLFHFALFSILSTQVLILDNKLPVPKRFWVFCVALGLGLTLCFPWLHLVHSSLFLPGIEMRGPGQIEGVKLEWMQQNLLSILWGSVYSLILAIVAAMIATILTRQSQQSHYLTWLGMFTCIGLWLGWQAALLISVISLLTFCNLLIFSRIATGRKSEQQAFYLAVMVLVVAIVHHTLWNVVVNTMLNLFS